MHINVVQEFYKSDTAFQTATIVTVCFVITAWTSLIFHFRAVDDISRSTGEMCLTSNAQSSSCFVIY